MIRITECNIGKCFAGSKYGKTSLQVMRYVNQLLQTDGHVSFEVSCDPSSLLNRELPKQMPNFQHFALVSSSQFFLLSDGILLFTLSNYRHYLNRSDRQVMTHKRDQRIYCHRQLVRHFSARHLSVSVNINVNRNILKQSTERYLDDITVDGSLSSCLI